MLDTCTHLMGTWLISKDCLRPCRGMIPVCLLLCILLPVSASAAVRAASKPVALKPGQPCLDCHGKLNKQKYIHSATEGGQGCATLCHEQADPAQHRFAPPPAPIGPLCLGCHDQVVSAKDTHKHPPVADGDCTACHDPHQSDRAKLLRGAYPETFYQAYSEAAYELCLNCHDAAAFKVPRTTTATAFRNGDLNLHQRHVNKKKGRSCKACHDLHGAPQPHLIASAFRFGERGLSIAYETTDNGGSCVTSCHVKVSYDRLTPVNNPLRTSPRPGQDAVLEKLTPPVQGQKK
ncbi:MAG: cytochrome c3 family protein [Desulfurivibrionaceae bacterium]